MVNILPVDDYMSGYSTSLDGIVHAVQAPQKGRLPATRGSDTSGHLITGYGYGDILERLVLPIKYIHRIGFDFYRID